MELMAKKKTTEPGPAADRHKKVQTQLRLHPVIRRQLDILVERRISTLAEEITEAVREHLRRHGLWPPPEADKAEE